MIHPCACCRLRFTHQAELAEHVRSDHADRTPVPERRETIATSRVRPRPRGTLRLPW
ncbi:MAG: hypothetical protein JWO60_439 [Frankiales bacterium]|nr:hypothetical protein [Frankiales bacterium]